MVDNTLTVSGVAGRYARALFELALESKSVDAVKSDIEKFDALMRESEDLRRLVRSPVFGESGLNEIIMLVGCYVLACMLLRTWGVDIEQPKA